MHELVESSLPFSASTWNFLLRCNRVGSTDGKIVAGYYTLTQSSVGLLKLPEGRSLSAEAVRIVFARVPALAAIRKASTRSLSIPLVATKGFPQAFPHAYHTRH
jgi:hypothetical protein